ncbi:MAG: DUF1905 domain-containing protein [Chloroflexota bacterium]
MAEKVRFRSTIEQARGAGATVALVPAEVIPALGGLKQKRAFGWLNRVDFMTATFPFKGTLYVGVPKAARVAAGAVLGDDIELEPCRPGPPESRFALPPGRSRDTAICD